MRQAYTMKLKPGCVVEYKKRHDELWPELTAALRGVGVSDFSIFLDEKTLTLFVVRKIGDNAAFAKLPQLPIVRKWWDFMSPLMEVNADNSPKEWQMREVFHLD
jgi:L-rhamnose mutarotase